MDYKRPQPVRKFAERNLVIASHNAGKLHEIELLLNQFDVAISSAANHGLVEPAETEDNFIGNARIKAHFAASQTGFPALSDDSGISIEALDGAPGVYTADWAETPNGRDFPMAMTKVWRLLEECNAPSPRNAAFNCTLCLAWPDGHDEVFEGKVSGQIVWPMRGSEGFGFDPIFVPNGHNETFGEMDAKKKHAMSHRAIAFAKLVEGCFG